MGEKVTVVVGAGSSSERSEVEEGRLDAFEDERADAFEVREGVCRRSARRSAVAFRAGAFDPAARGGSAWEAGGAGAGGGSLATFPLGADAVFSRASTGFGSDSRGGSSTTGERFSFGESVRRSAGS